MIIYRESKDQFLQHARYDDIAEVVLRSFRARIGHGVGSSEMNAWRNSLQEMSRVLEDLEIPPDAGVAIEYQVPSSTKRLDFVVVGEDPDGISKIVIIELKQWSRSRRTDKDGLVLAHRGGRRGEVEGPHPSYQAWSYACLLRDFSEPVQEGEFVLQPCAYLHNHPRDGEIDHSFYDYYLKEAPLFLAQERARLQAFIRGHVRHGDRRNALYYIDRGRIKPSKILADHVAGLLEGRSEFVLVDDQKVAYETILQADMRATEGIKQVVIVQGGPGTGKSLIALNLLGTLLKRERNTRYVSKNGAPRAVYQAQLTRSFTQSRISNLFSGSSSFVDCEPGVFHTLVIDEAHRLNEKSGLYSNLGDNQVKELIRAADCTVFFVDDNQRVTLRDIGSLDEIRRHAEEAGAEITELQLVSQFRCNGSDDYLTWLAGTLGVGPDDQLKLGTASFDFRVFDDPNELHRLIELKNRAGQRARMVAGYCWNWTSKQDAQAWDIDLDDFDYRRQWNLQTDGSLWIVKPNSVEQVGCIHTCQGLELDYVGVIVGPDMTYRDGRIITDGSKRASTDTSLRGWKKMSKADPTAAQVMADRIIKNTYSVLMTRGMKGCYVYCTDEPLAEFIRGRLHSLPESVTPAVGSVPPLRPLSWPRIDTAEAAAGAVGVPIVELQFAAGAFSGTQTLEDGAQDWVALPEWISPQPRLFVARVVGESMNRRIPNASWCLFLGNPTGTRQNKIVVVRHRAIADPDTGGQYTIKRYTSVKSASDDGEWTHERIVLQPETDRPGYEPIVLESSLDDDEFAVVAEFLMVIENA